MADSTYVINPLTNRKIQVGGAKYFELVRKGLIDGEVLPEVKKVPKNQNRVLKAECEDEDHAKEVRDHLMSSQPLPEGETYKVVGNKIYVAKKNAKNLTRKLQVEEMTKSALKTVKEVAKNPESLQKLENNDEELLKQIRTLLQQNLLTRDTTLEDIQESVVYDETKNQAKQKSLDRKVNAEGPRSHTRGKSSSASSSASERAVKRNARIPARNAQHVSRKIYSDSEQSLYESDASTCPKPQLHARDEQESADESDESDGF